jgi:hypothetical protein
MTRSIPHVYSSAESRKARLTGMDKSDTIFQKFSRLLNDSTSIYDLSNNSCLRLIGGWMVEGFCVEKDSDWWESSCTCTGFEGRENLSRRSVRMILLIFRAQAHQTNAFTILLQWLYLSGPWANVVVKFLMHPQRQRSCIDFLLEYQ